MSLPSLRPDAGPSAGRGGAFRRILWLALTLATLYGCDDRELRGRVEASSDGGTYLVIEDGNGGACGPLRVDGKLWPHTLYETGAIAPGRHEVECGTRIAIEIEKGTTFHVDYWGP
ncbi:MAG TPA: hypothetical protein VFW45_11700 [Candidatus Polarisedimenticolia bacterium]|nr:hypothetical protein [Candidatus Polarisedimenticolia bacterium]